MPFQTNYVLMLFQVTFIIFLMLLDLVLTFWTCDQIKVSEFDWFNFNNQ